MSRKVNVPSYERLLLEIGTLTVAQLEVMAACVKVRLSQIKPKGSRPKAVKEEKAS